MFTVKSKKISRFLIAIKQRAYKLQLDQNNLFLPERNFVSDCAQVKTNCLAAKFKMMTGV